MEGKSNAKLYYLFSIICGTWFLITGWLWAYFLCLIISYPIGLIGIFLWSKGKKLNPGSKVAPIALWIHIIGLIISLGTFAGLYFSN